MKVGLLYDAYFMRKGGKDTLKNFSLFFIHRGSAAGLENNKKKENDFVLIWKQYIEIFIEHFRFYFVYLSAKPTVQNASTKILPLND